MMAFSLTCCPTSCASGIHSVQKKKRFIKNKTEEYCRNLLKIRVMLIRCYRMGMQLCLMKPSLIARHVEHQPPFDCVTALGVSSLCTHSENLKRQTCGESRPFAFLLVFNLRRRWKPSAHTGLSSSTLSLTFVCLLE